jgi:acyl-CoA thioesterase
VVSTGRLLWSAPGAEDYPDWLRSQKWDSAGVAREGIDGVSRFMGMRWDSADTVRVEVRPDLINAAGLLSGAVTYALVDPCMGSALWKETTDEESIATVSITINYVQTATDGEVICRTALDRRNRRLAVLRSEVRLDDGRLIATAIGSHTIFPNIRRPDVETKSDAGRDASRR